jgi:aspartate-semialdehyde dehydrogenase
MSEASEPCHDVAIFGITGALGREIQAALEVAHEGIDRFFAVAGTRSAGLQTRWRGAALGVIGPQELAASDVDFAIFATPAETVTREAPRFLEAGARVIDASAALASPPVPRALKQPAPIAWPTLSTFDAIDLELATAIALPSAAVSTLAPLIDAILVGTPIVGLPRLLGLDVTALMPASQAGRSGIEALSRQAVGMLNYQPVIDPRPFPAVLAFNAIAPPPAQAVLFEGRTTSELRRMFPTLGDRHIEVAPIWIPAFSGLCLSVTLHFEGCPDPVGLEKVLAAHPDLSLPGDTDEPELDEGVELLEPEDSDEPEGAPSVPEDPQALSLRDSLERDDVRLSAPLYGPDGSVRVVLMADPIARTAVAASTLLTRWMAALDA